LIRNKIDLNERFLELGRPLILDGALGSLLSDKSDFIDNNLWSSIFNITNPDHVTKIHEAYINAGAEILTTNTFRTNPHAFSNSHLNITYEEFLHQSVKLAHESILDNKIIIAGSNAPAEDCYQQARILTYRELDYNHKIHIELLWEDGCDIIWNETQSHWDEIGIISRFCSDNSLPFVINIYFKDDFSILSGQPLSEVIDFITDYAPIAIGFNCIKPKLLREYFEHNKPPKSWGFYLNCGSGGNVHDKIIHCEISPNDYIKEIDEFVKMTPMFVGSCCGSTYEHTKAIKDYFNELYRN
jgi:homocysteine S-methyltransferase